jgi:hypothetical protein
VYFQHSTRIISDVWPQWCWKNDIICQTCAHVGHTYPPTLIFRNYICDMYKSLGRSVALIAGQAFLMHARTSTPYFASQQYIFF